MDYKLFGEYLIKIRLSLGYSQEDVRRITGISISSLTRLENGKNSMQVRILAKLSELYKIDLFYILSKCRNKNELLSEKLVKDIVHYVNIGDFSAFKSVVLEQIEYYKHIKLTEEGDAEVQITLLKAYMDMDAEEFRNGQVNKVLVEQLLIDIQQSRGRILSDSVLYSIEIIAALYLVALYRKDGEFDRALSILGRIDGYLESDMCLIPEHSSFIGAALVSRAYIYHRMDRDQEIVELLTSALENENFLFRRTTLSDIHLRLGQAYHFLGDEEEAKNNFTVALMYGSIQRKRTISKIMIEKYDINHPMAVRYAG